MKIAYLLIVLLAASSAFAAPPAPARPKDQTPATAPASDDTLMLDGNTEGTRALSASYYLAAKPWTALGVTTGNTTAAWGTKNTATLTGDLAITSFTGTEDAKSWYFIQGVFNGSQTFTFPASYRNGQTNTTTSTLTPAAGRHTFKFESLNGSGTYLLTDTVATATPASSVSVEAGVANYTPASASAEEHFKAIDSKFGTLEIGGDSFAPKMSMLWPTADLGSKPSGWLAAGEGGTPSFTAIGSYSLIVKSAGTVATPTFSPAAGSYGSAQSVTISSATSGAAIRYTTDGSSPTRSSGTVYSSPVSVAASATVKAIAYKDYSADSSVANAAYVIGGAPLAYVQSVAGSNNFGGATTAGILPANVTAGNLIVVGIQWQGMVARTISSVTDTLGNTYTLNAASKSTIVTANAAGGINTQFAYATAATSGACTVTVTFSGAVGGGFATVAEITDGEFDQVAVATATSSGAAISVGPLTTTSNGCLALSIAMFDNGTGGVGGWTAGSGWTNIQNTGGGWAMEGAQYRTLASAGTVTGDMPNSTGSGTWTASMIVFKP